MPGGRAIQMSCSDANLYKKTKAKIQTVPLKNRDTEKKSFFRHGLFTYSLQLMSTNEKCEWWHHLRLNRTALSIL